MHLSIWFFWVPDFLWLEFPLSVQSRRAAEKNVFKCPFFLQHIFRIHVVQKTNGFKINRDFIAKFAEFLKSQFSFLDSSSFLS